MFERPLDCVRMVERSRLQEVRFMRSAIDIDPESLLVLNLEQLELVDELPVASQSSVGCGAEWSCLLVGEVGLQVDEPDHTA